MPDPIEQRLQQAVQEAHRNTQPLNIIGGGSKAFYGREATGMPLHTAAHRGVVRYDPAELVLSARAGTTVAEVEALLAKENQMLGFEPPRFGGRETTTLGGMVAAGLAGPRRPYAGAVRDFVLGVKILNGKGDIMRFGGEVMKNVAGFDLARLMAGAMGVLGVVLEISLRIIPRPPVEKTLVLEHPQPAAAVALFNRLAARPLPLSAAAWHAGETRIRLSGGAEGVKRAAEVIGGEEDAVGGRFWQRLRDHELAFFQEQRQLLRVSAPPAAELGALDMPQLVDWGGAQRWLVGDADGEALREIVARHGGHVTRFRHGDRRSAVFQPLAAPLHALHLGLKRAFDPAGILNPGRLYRDW